MDVYEGKKSTDKWYPVRLVDSSDGYTPETGKTYSAMTVKYGYEAATSETSYALGSGDWSEQGDGNYWMRIGAGEFGSEGKYVVKCEALGVRDVSFMIEVRDKTLAELIDDVEALNDPSAADVADAVWDEAVADHQGAGATGKWLHLLKAALLNRVEYDYVLHQVKIYNDDDTTVLVTLDISSITDGVREDPV